MINIQTSQDAVNSALDLIENRRTGRWRSLRSRWKKLNKATMGGVEPNTIVTLGGISGSGKTSVANMLIEDFNKDHPGLITLFLSFEMLPERLVLRSLSSKLGVQVRELFSADTPLGDDKMKLIGDSAAEIAKEKTFYIAEALTPDEIETVVNQFKQKLSHDQMLLVVIDHVLLVKGMSSENAKQTIDNLEVKLNFLKKKGRIIILQLSQLNRDIESTVRILNKQVHYPLKADLSSSDSMYQYSDYVWVVHMPAGLGITEYGPYGIPTKDKVFIHCLKI